MMKNTKRQSWIDLLPPIVIGAEDPIPANDPLPVPAPPTPKPSDIPPVAPAAPSGAPAADEDEDDGEGDKNISGLKSALAAERKANKDREKELKTLRKEKEDRELAGKSEVEQAKIKADNAIATAAKLASGILKRDLDDAIRTAASAFIDPTDAVDGVDRSSLVFEQDSDDPSKVTIDKKSVEAAVKKLTTLKPHYLKVGTDDGEPSGSQFGANQRKPKTGDDVYKERYPSLA